MQTLTIQMNRHTNQPDERDWSTASLRSLIDHLVGTHHAYLRKELPALETLIAVAMNQPSGASTIGEVHRLVQHLHRDLELQMRKEEAIVFPAILALEANVAPNGRPDHSQFGSLKNLAKVTAGSHDQTLRAVEEISRLTNGYTLSSDSGPGTQAICRRLAVMAADIKRHIFLENEILFPRAASLEGEVQ
jgi:regulator of cell morphogenesis and NO signaling